MSATSERTASTADPQGEFPRELTSYLFHLFAVVSRHREARLETELKPIGLNLSRHRALSVISTLQPCTMSELADFSAVDRTTLTRTVDQLVDSGLVERTTPREDRRQVLLTLTEQGRTTCQRSLRAIYDVLPDASTNTVTNLFGVANPQYAATFGEVTPLLAFAILALYALACFVVPVVVTRRSDLV